MSDTAILDRLRKYVADTILEGHDVGLDASTPLLEHGVLNSMEIVRLVSFIEKDFGISVPGEMILAENFTSLRAIAGMVAGLQDGPAAQSGAAG